MTSPLSCVLCGLLLSRSQPVIAEIPCGHLLHRGCADYQRKLAKLEARQETGHRETEIRCSLCNAVVKTQCQLFLTPTSEQPNDPELDRIHHLQRKHLMYVNDESTNKLQTACLRDLCAELHNAVSHCCKPRELIKALPTTPNQLLEQMDTPALVDYISQLKTRLTQCRTDVEVLEERVSKARTILRFTPRVKLLPKSRPQTIHYKTQRKEDLPSSRLDAASSNSKELICVSDDSTDEDGVEVVDDLQFPQRSALLPSKHQWSVPLRSLSDVPKSSATLQMRLP